MRLAKGHDLVREGRESALLTRPGYPLTFVLRARGKITRVGRRFASRLADLGIRRPYIVSSRHGSHLLEDVSAVRNEPVPTLCTEAEARALARRIASTGADAAVFIGGGRVLDIGKAASTFAGVPMIAVPTQLSHDGIASPVAVVQGIDGGKRSLAVSPPAAVFLSLPTLQMSPIASLTAGLGDLLSNEWALRDWVVAVADGRDVLVPEAYGASLESLHLVESLFDQDPHETLRDPLAIGLLGVALVNSGLAMLAAGSSRPASGAEHKISHAIDVLYGGRAMHGAQVAFASAICAHLHGEDAFDVLRRLRILGLPSRPSDLGLTLQELRTALVFAARSRPERYTVLDRFEIDERSARTLLAQVWPELSSTGDELERPLSA